MPRSRPRFVPLASPSRVDFLALANHIFVLCSIGYIVGNFFRSIVGSQIDAQLSDAFANSLFFFLALLFVVDAILYYACMFDGVFPVKGTPREGTRPQAGAEGVEVDAEPHLNETGGGEARPRSTSLTSISTTISNQEADFTPLATPTTDDYWLTHSDLDQVSSSSYSLHTDAPPTAPSTSNGSTSTSTSVSASVKAFPAPLNDLTDRTLFPLTIDGWGELLNVSASIIALLSSILPFLSVLSFDNSGAGDSFLRFQIVADNTSMMLWMVDALVYFWAWKRGLPKPFSTGKKRRGVGWWHPREPYMWANVFNVLASVMYVVSAVYAAVGVRVTEWLLGDDSAAGNHYDMRLVQREQRTLALAGDVLYLVSAVTMEIAWYHDKRTEELHQQRRRHARLRRFQREKEAAAHALLTTSLLAPTVKDTAINSSTASTLPHVAPHRARTSSAPAESAATKGRRLPKVDREKTGRKAKREGEGVERDAVLPASSSTSSNGSSCSGEEPGAPPVSEEGEREQKRTPREERARQRELRRQALGSVALPTFHSHP